MMDVPSLSFPKTVDLMQPEVLLAQEQPLHCFSNETNQAISLHLRIPLGKYHQELPAQAFFTAKALTKGTAKFSADDITETLAKYGAEIRCKSAWHQTTIALHCLAEYLPNLLPLLRDVVLNPKFEEEELAVLRAKQKRIIRKKQAENDYNVLRTWFEKVYGPQHPFGKRTAVADFDQLTAEQNLAHWAKANLAHRYATYCGPLNPIIEQCLQNNLVFEDTSPAKLPLSQAPKIEGEHLSIEGPNKDQSALFAGLVWPGENHEDSADLHLLHLFFGGYFGSRLMKNIREEKGYTYGIYSQIIPLPGYNLFVVSTDVGMEHRESTWNEIEHEIHRLHTEPIPKDEFEMAMNYAFGNTLMQVDGAQRVAGLYRQAHALGLDPTDQVAKRIQAIRNMTPQRLKNLAKTYLHFGNLLRIDSV